MILKEPLASPLNSVNNQSLSLAVFLPGAASRPADRKAQLSDHFIGKAPPRTSLAGFYLGETDTFSLSNFFILQDLHTVDLEDFKFSKTRITSYRLVTASTELLSILEEWPILAQRLGRKAVNPPKNIKVSLALHRHSIKLFLSTEPGQLNRQTGISRAIRHLIMDESEAVLISIIMSNERPKNDQK